MAPPFEKNRSYNGAPLEMNPVREWLLKYAVYLIKDYEQAGDLVQEALEVYLAKGFGLKNDEQGRNYLRGIIHNRFLMLYRKKQHEVLTQYYPEVEDKEGVEKLKSVAIEKVLEAVRNHKDGQLVEAIYLNGEKPGVLAKRLNIKYATLMKRKERALADIYQALKQHIPENDE